MVCPFCQIASGNLEASVVFEDEQFIAFLDIKPVFLGHVLLTPKTHIETLADVPQDLLAPLMQRVQRLSAVMPRALGCQGTFVAMNNKVSQSVPHMHVHVVPRTKGDGLRGFFWPRTKYASSEEMESYRAKLAEAYATP